MCERLALIIVSSQSKDDIKYWLIRILSMRIPLTGFQLAYMVQGARDALSAGIKSIVSPFEVGCVGGDGVVDVAVGG